MDRRGVVCLVVYVLALSSCGKVMEVAVNKEDVIKMPLTTPGYGGVTQSPEMFNYYVSVLEKSLGKMPCRAAAGGELEPCMTDTFKEIERRVTKACSRE